MQGAIRDHGVGVLASRTSDADFRTDIHNLIRSCQIHADINCMSFERIWCNSVHDGQIRTERSMDANLRISNDRGSVGTGYPFQMLWVATGSHESATISTRIP